MSAVDRKRQITADALREYRHSILSRGHRMGESAWETVNEIDAMLANLGHPAAKDVNGEDTPWTQVELDGMIEALESTGRYDVVGRKW